MGKKNTTTNKADAPTKRAAKETTKGEVATPSKAAPQRKPAAKRRATTTVAKAAFSEADIALRAYFVSEKRRALGIPGDEKGDWLEAERQLISEKSGGKKK